MEVQVWASMGPPRCLPLSFCCPKMATQFRDTAFGRLVRLASSNRLLRYPDEIDPTLWKRFLPSEKANGLSAEASTADGTIRDLVEGGMDIYLVDWYGPDDPEVTDFFDAGLHSNCSPPCV